MAAPSRIQCPTRPPAENDYSFTDHHEDLGSEKKSFNWVGLFAGLVTLVLGVLTIATAAKHQDVLNEYATECVARLVGKAEGGKGKRTSGKGKSTKQKANAVIAAVAVFVLLVLVYAAGRHLYRATIKPPPAPPPPAQYARMDMTDFQDKFGAPAAGQPQAGQPQAGNPKAAPQRTKEEDQAMMGAATLRGPDDELPTGTLEEEYGPIDPEIRDDDPSIEPEMAERRDAFEKRYPMRNFFIRWAGGHRGWTLCAKRELSPWEVSMVFPHKEAITVDTGRQLAEGTRLNELTYTGFEKATMGVEMVDFFFLAFALLHEKYKGPESLFAEYIAMLPERPGGLLFMSDEELACTPNYMQALNKFQISVFDAVKRGLGAANQVTELMPVVPSDDEVKWALANIFSRASFSSDPWKLGLYPWVDMANHDMSGHNVVDGAKHPVLGIEAEVTVSNTNMLQGDEIFHTYGDVSMQQAFMRYGFVPDHPQLLSLESFGSMDHVDPEDECNMPDQSGAGLCLSNEILYQFKLGEAAPVLQIAGMKCMRGHPAKDLAKHLEMCSISPEEELQKRVMQDIGIYEALTKKPECQETGGHFDAIKTYNEAVLNTLHTIKDDLMPMVEETEVLKASLDPSMYGFVNRL